MKKPRSARYHVPDLSPLDHPKRFPVPPKVIFVAESPHIQEVTPEDRAERRPLCGPAGRKWWGKVRSLLEEPGGEDVSLPSLLDLCGRRGLAVLNAVQQPLDPKITRVFKDADPLELLGFGKAPGELSYKRHKSRPAMGEVLQSLRDRLEDARLGGAPIYCLGNDAEWFVTQALGRGHARLKGRLPHPSAWWRRGGYFGKVAEEKLAEIFGTYL